MAAFFSNYKLLNYNTFHLQAETRYFAEIFNEADIYQLLDSKIPEQHPAFVLGGGSNVLFTKDFDGIVIHPRITGLQIIPFSDTECIVKAGAGVIWDELVQFCVGNNLSGIENLSLIPGSVGASPVQNIGAYGVEIKDSFFELEAFDLTNGIKNTFTNAECAFGYRDSIFKKTLKNKMLITNVSFKLSRILKPVLNYGNLQQLFENKNDVSLKSIRDAIVKIREEKLPNPDILGNAGSFFKNPTLSVSHVENLKKEFPSIPVYPFDKHHQKIAAGWLIEQSGWKGKKNKQGTVGVHQNQALVLINYGNAKGEEVLELANQVKEDVNSKFGILLDFEVNIL